MSVPEGFAAMETRSPFSNWAGPFYTRVDEDHVVLGFEVAAHHCNSGGRLHGSMICGAADLAIGRNVGRALAREGRVTDEQFTAQGRGGAPIATVTLNTDFAGYASEGDWVEVHVDVQKAGGKLSFANAYVVAGGQRIARASAVFTVL